MSTGTNLEDGVGDVLWWQDGDGGRGGGGWC